MIIRKRIHETHHRRVHTMARQLMLYSSVCHFTSILPMRGTNTSPTHFLTDQAVTKLHLYLKDHLNRKWVDTYIALCGKLVEQRKLGFNPIKYEPMPTASIFCFILSEVNVTPLFRGLTHKMPWFEANSIRNLDGMPGKWAIISDKKWNSSETSLF